jgi:hypothetical protein
MWEINGNTKECEMSKKSDEIKRAIQEHEMQKESGLVGQTVKRLYVASLRKGLRTALQTRLQAEQHATEIACMLALQELDYEASTSRDLQEDDVLVEGVKVPEQVS